MNDNPAPSTTPRDGLSFIHSSLDDAGLDPAEFRVYCHVNRVAGRGGVCHAALSTIAQHCGYCDDTTRNALKRLTGLNMLLKNYIPGVGTEYRLTSPKNWKLDAPTPLRKNPRGVRMSQGTTPKKSYHHPSEKVVGKVNPVKGSPIKVLKGVNLVKHQAAGLTNLTANAASMERIAREIGCNEHGWHWDNCKVSPPDIVPASIEKVLEPYAGQFHEQSIHDAWREAVTRTHKAAVDGLSLKPAAYCVTCFKEQLNKSAVAKKSKESL